VSLIIDVAETVKLSADSGSTIKNPEKALVEALENSAV
jgi:hypothetical protein